MLKGVKSIGKAKLFCVSLSTGLISKYLCQGIALQFSRNINISKGDPILLQSNQYLSTFRPSDYVGVLAYFEGQDGIYTIGRVGNGESFIKRNFNTQNHKEFWLAPINIRSGRSYGLLCQICGDVSWFSTNSLQHKYPPVNIMDNRIQQCRKGGSMFFEDEVRFIKEQKQLSLMTRKKYFLNKDLAFKEYVLWRKIALGFSIPTQIDKNAICSQIHAEKNNTVPMMIDNRIPDVTGMLAIS